MHRSLRYISGGAEMEKDFARDVIQNAPFGYAHHKLIMDNKGKPNDYVFIDVNLAFEDMTGLNIEETIGKRVVDVIPGIREDEFDWIDFFGKVAMDGKRRRITKYMKPLGRWFKVSALSFEKGYFTVLFQDVTEEMQRIEKLELQKKQITRPSLGENLQNMD